MKMENCRSILQRKRKGKRMSNFETEKIGKKWRNFQGLVFGQV